MCPMDQMCLSLSVSVRDFDLSLFVFWIDYPLLLASFLLSLSFFSYQGWLEFGIFAKIFRTVNASNKIDDSKKIGAENEEVLQRAEAEDTRRREESMYMRSSYNHFSSRLSGFGLSRRNGSNSNSQIQNHYPNTSMQSKQTVQEQLRQRNSNLNASSEQTRTSEK